MLAATPALAARIGRELATEASAGEAAAGASLVRGAIRNNPLSSSRQGLGRISGLE